jgi:hypothetical protein
LVQLRFRSVSIISGKFESRFKQCDESEVNADRQKRRCNKSLITDSPDKRALPESGQQALTVALESAVTMRRGGPALPPGAARWPMHRRHAQERAPAPPVHRPPGRATFIGRGSSCGRPPHPSAGECRFGLRPQESRDGGCSGGGGSGCTRSGLHSGFLALAGRRHQDLDTARRDVAVRSKRERIETQRRRFKAPMLRGVGEHSEG